jgi:hypothetical protein
VNIEEFYSADERRRRSEEVDLGTEWHDADGARFELSWVADTGEIYLMSEPALREFPHDPTTNELVVSVIGNVADRDELDRRLAGWQQAMTEPDSVVWLTDRIGSGASPSDRAES